MEDLTIEELLREALKHARDFLQLHVSGVRMANESIVRASRPVDLTLRVKKTAIRERKDRLARLERTLRSHTHAKAYAERVILALEEALADPAWTLETADMKAIDGLRDLLKHLEVSATAPIVSHRINERINSTLGMTYRGSEREAELATAWNLRVRSALRALFAQSTKG